MVFRAFLVWPGGTSHSSRQAPPSQVPQHNWNQRVDASHQSASASSHIHNHAVSETESARARGAILIRGTAPCQRGRIGGGRARCRRRPRSDTCPRPRHRASRPVSACRLRCPD
eukprot:2373951-Rhodomonas_salina.3